MDEGFSRLAARVDALADSLEKIEARLRAVEEQTASGGGERSSTEEVTKPEMAVSTAAAERPQAVPILTLVGQTCLVLCGAFLLRAMTDMAVFPTQIGLTLGLVYGIGWLLFGDVLARRGKQLAATFFGISAIIIAYPLLGEAATTFGAVGGVGSAVVLSVVTAIALGVAWRHDLPVLAWLTTIAAIATAFGLVLATHRMVPFAVALLLLGLGMVWITHTRGWVGLRWLPAIAVTVLMSFVVFLASRPQGIPESYPDVSVPWAVALVLGLVSGYLGSFAVQTLLRGRDVSVFEMVQTLAVLIVGFGMTVQVAEAAGIGSV